MTDVEPDDDLAASFFALSNDRRLCILHLVDEPHTRSELTDELDISRQAVTKHVDTLLEHGFVREVPSWTDAGPVDRFQVDPKHPYALGKTLVDLGKLEPEESPLGATEGTPDAKAPSDPKAHLLILDGPDAGERFDLDEGDTWTIGRGDDRDLQLDHDPYIFNHQREIQTTPNGHAVVDVYSSSGTVDNFAQLPEGGRSELGPGDVIGIGRTSLVYQSV